MIHNECFSAVPVSFAGAYLHHENIEDFFRMCPEKMTGQQGVLFGLGPGLKGFNTLLPQYGLEWDGAEYNPLVFLRTFHREVFVLCGFYLKDKNEGHAIAFFADPQPTSGSLYIFDPNHGLFRGDSGYSFDDQLEYFLLSKYPDIDPRRVSFRNVKRAGY
ncbi:MAG: hypothetical protein LRY55_01050 [Leadbetterella sp.]|nr:hypothetical protein [Leadbetterella sp.]